MGMEPSHAAVGQWQNFYSGLEEMRDLLMRHSCAFEPLDERNRQYFLSLEDERRGLLLTSLHRQLAIYNSAEQEGIALEDSEDLLPYALQHLRLSIDPKFFALIKSTDVVEVYSQDHIQLFRSFNFFSLCNYNLDDVMMHEWYYLYERAKSVTDALLEECRLQNEGHQSIREMKTPAHLMRERYSNPRGLFRIHFKYMTSAFSGPNVREGYLVTQSCDVLEILES